ncbi:Vegetative incompatibility protein HET-E-1 [Tolypocladium ophioglossoides CBS 100239]|uniref:Vegetative incompatibility protein HET-E-1 n=1 Tax=Tolypocladium ophioglossoides (strain CBS 100239) TaxID=1163406 RepID=A0A0L0MZS7_TOLOC|nr:Vegetative incompatibility protein HET-E-1 [Tolypocladium ophioglossoides CBS 100239]
MRTILDSPDLYAIGWIAALPIERAAATALLDDRHETPEGFDQHQCDTNSYTWGRVGEHNIVIASLPAGVYGIISAATTASNLIASLPHIRIGLLVGIGGGIAQPHRGRDIRLGDVVVSQPDGTIGGVIQYDLGKAKLNQTWERKGSLNMPPPVLLNALASLQAEHEIAASRVPDLLQAMWAANPQMMRPKNKVPGFVHQGFENDRLFMSTYDHAGGNACDKCDLSWEVERGQRDTTDPEIHYVSENLESIQSATTSVDQKTVLDRLPVAAGASFDSYAEEQNPTCLPNTRIELLDQIIEWAENSRAESIFWLNGMAGTGKSTISRTIAKSFDGTGNLGASFFFKRGEGDRGNSSKLFTTIAAQLAASRPAIAPHIKNAIDSDSAIGNKGLRQQFDKLILQPLSKVSPNAGKAGCTVILIDALDECELEDEVKLIIDLFGRAKSPGLRIFVTSRPELPIRLGFHDIECKHHDVTLHEIPAPVIERDLSVFFQHKLATIRAEYNVSVSEDGQLPADWPGKSNIQCLITMAIPLFIFAATVCRFLADRRCGNPDEQLQEVMRYRTKSQESQLDATYLPVLNKLVVGFPSKKRDKVLQQFRAIVGSIIILASPLSITALAQILSIPQGAIDSQLGMLHAVLSIPQSAKSPVRLLHLSFRDFLLDPEKQGENLFWVDETLAHSKMATNCLRILKEFLRADICGLRPSGMEGSTIDRQKIDAYIPAEVQYACLNWVFHLRGAQNHVGDCGESSLFLKHHFLHWIEALSLMRRAPESIRIIESLQAPVS